LDDAPNPQKKVDEDWKEQIEKERKPDAKNAAPSPEKPPEAEGDGKVNFALFLSTLAMQAFVALGEMPDPQSQKTHENLEQARYMIDILTLIENKTKGNLTGEEEKMLTSVLYELRMKFVDKKKGSA